MLKAVLFDMDGVLVDTEGQYAKTELRLAKKYGIPLNRVQQRSYRGRSVLETWTELTQGSDIDASVIARLEEELMGEYYAKGALRPIRPSLRLLERCAKSGLKIAVATSSSRQNAKDFVRRFGLGKYIQGIAASDMVEKAKPEPDIFQLAAGMLGVSPEECIVIDDAISGVAAAKAAGMKVIHLKARDNPDTAGADLVIRTLRGVGADTLRSLFNGI